MLKKMKLLLIFLFLPSLCFGETIQGDYCYTYGDKESLKEARETARALAVRNAIESYEAFVKSTTNVENFQLTNDLVRMLSAGYLRNIKTIEHSEKDRTICDKIEANIEPAAFENAIREEIGKVPGKKDEAGAEANDVLRLLNVKESDSVYYSSSGTKEYIEVTIKALKDVNSKTPVMIDFYDSGGNQINGSRQLVNDLYKGEIKTIKFVKDPNSSSYRVWLPQ